MIRRRFLSTLSAGCALILASCGGESGSGQGSPIGGPTPTPTPPATPNPAAYPSGFDFAYDILVQSPYVEMTYARVSTSADPAQDTVETAQAVMVENPQAVLRWTASTKLAQVQVNGATTDFPASADQTENPKRKYRILGQNDDQLLLLWGGDIVSNGFDQNIRDVGVAWKDDRVCPISSARCNITIRRFLAGPLTPASEPPPTSKADYPAYINLTPVANAPYARLDPLFIQGDELEMVIDFSAGTLKEKFTVVGGIAINSIRFTGTIDRSRNFPIRGTFTHIANNRVSGTFIGNFYGPQGREIGLLLQGQAEDGTPVIGYVVGYYWRPEP